MRILFVSIALAFAVMAQPALADRNLVSPAVPHWINKSDFVVQPKQNWTYIGRGGVLPRVAAMWTIDGEDLNTITFYTGLKEKEKMFTQGSSAPNQLPRFNAKMQPQELAEFVESSYRIATGSTQFTVTNLQPFTFAGQPGFQMDVDFVGQADELKRKGRIAGAVREGKLYLIVYQAAALHFFDQYLAEADAVIASARFEAAPKQRR
jgi:hypothetical protein